MIIYNFFKSLYLNIKYTKLLKKIYKDEHLIENISQLCGVEFKVDWIGRIYTVLNPNLVDKQLDTNKQIYEYGKNGLNNDAYIEKWICDRLNIANRFIRANNLFDLLSLNIKKLDDYDNYLLTIFPITLPDCISASKKMGWRTLGIIIAIISIFFIV